MLNINKALIIFIVSLQLSALEVFFYLEKPDILRLVKLALIFLLVNLAFIAWLTIHSSPG